MKRLLLGLAFCGCTVTDPQTATVLVTNPIGEDVRVGFAVPIPATLVYDLGTVGRTPRCLTVPVHGQTTRLLAVHGADSTWSDSAYFAAGMGYRWTVGGTMERATICE